MHTRCMQISTKHDEFHTEMDGILNENGGFCGKRYEGLAPPVRNILTDFIIYIMIDFVANMMEVIMKVTGLILK